MHRFLVCLASLAVVCSASADEKKSAPAATRVFVSGRTSGEVYMKESSGKEVKQVRVTLFKLDDKTLLAVALPQGPSAPQSKPAKVGGADPDLARALEEASKAQDLAVEGRLSSTQNPVVVAAT